MKYFIVTYIHTDVEGWKKHLAAHVAYLEKLIKDGKLRVSGPFVGTPEKSAMLILSVRNSQEALELIEKDPYSIEGLVAESTFTEWNPIFGDFQSPKHKFMLFWGKLLERKKVKADK
jgi:uncharacterized protein YciI